MFSNLSCIMRYQKAQINSASSFVSNFFLLNKPAGLQRHKFRSFKLNFYSYILHQSRLKNNLEENFVCDSLTFHSVSFLEKDLKIDSALCYIRRVHYSPAPSCVAVNFIFHLSVSFDKLLNSPSN